MTLPKEVREGLETFALPLRFVFYSAGAIAVACIVPSIFHPNKAIAQKFAMVGGNCALVSLVAAIPSIAIGSVLIGDAKKRIEGHIHLAASHQYARSILREFVPEAEPSQPAGDSVKKPAACEGCQHYDGSAYGGNHFVCAMHPYGCDAKQCPDWEGQKTKYRIVRIQGAAPGLSASFYFIKDGVSTRDAIAQGEGIYCPHVLKSLCQKYKLRSVNGLPGCIFETNSPNIHEAWRQLVYSCSDE